METLYKYSNLLPLNYFDSPTIKLSIPEHLNDPFEYSTSDNIAIAIKTTLSLLEISTKDKEHHTGVLINAIHRMISVNGIISLSETPRNSLMWAHYAGQHKGMCIGYKKNLVEHISPNNNDSEDITKNKPLKVNYDNLRFPPEYIFYDLHDADKFSVIDHLLKKSDEWIYEKEHRCIIPYLSANKILIKNKELTRKIIKASNRAPINVNGPSSTLDWINTALLMNVISATDIENTYLINKANGEVTEAMLRSTLQILSNFEGISFLIDIDESMVDSVYFGCKVEKDEIKPYYDKLKSKISIFHLEVCNIRFELIPRKVTDEYFD